MFNNPMEKHDKNTIGDRIRFALAHHPDGKKPQTFLCEPLGVSQAAVSEWIKGKSSPKKPHKLAEALKVSLTWLLTGEGDPRMQPPAPEVLQSRDALWNEFRRAVLEEGLAGKAPAEILAELNQRTHEYFWPDVEKGKPPTYDQIIRFARQFLGREIPVKKQDGKK